jgi:hypothetical protein
MMMESPDLDRIRVTIEESLAVALGAVQFPGIVNAELKRASLSSKHLQGAATKLARNGHCSLRVAAEVEVFLRISNSDVLSSIEHMEFVVLAKMSESKLCAVATNEQDWRITWERGMEGIKDPALQGIRRDIWKMDDSLAEDSHTFRAAMVLLTSELVGPYIDRIATFVGYPRAIVQVIAARLQEAKIWEGNEVRCESWFDARIGAAAFLLDLMVAEGQLVRRWSQERDQYTYSESGMKQLSQFAI